MRAVMTVDDVKTIIVDKLPEWIEAHPDLRRRLAELSAPVNERSQDETVPPGRMTYEEFLDWCDEDTLAEWVALPGREAGEVVMYSPASRRHQDIVGFLLNVMSTFVEQGGLGVVLSAPFQMKLEHSGREPDLLFVTHEHQDRLKQTYLDGPADLAVEIVSLESIGRDRGEKFGEYEAGGIPEYWLIDPLRKRAEFYRLDDEGKYDTVFAGREGVFRSQVITDFWLRVEWLWQDPPPLPIEVLGEIAGIDPALIEAFVKALAGEAGN